MKPTPTHCDVCGPRVKASYRVDDRSVCRRHLSAAVESKIAKGGAVMVERLPQ